jgi:hypothetical protein
MKSAMADFIKEGFDLFNRLLYSLSVDFIGVERMLCDCRDSADFSLFFVPFV